MFHGSAPQRLFNAQASVALAAPATASQSQSLANLPQPSAGPVAYAPPMQDSSMKSPFDASTVGP